MRRVFFLAAVCLAAASFACGSDGDGAEDAAGFDPLRAKADIEHLADTIGPRAAGSEANVTAAEYITQGIANPSFGVFRQKFTFESDPNRAATVRLDGTALPAATAGGSAAGSASGVAVDVGTGAAITPGSIAGKVAVATRGGSSFREKYEAVRAGGAAALIVVNNEPGELIANLGTTARFPVVTMAGSDAAPLLAAAAGATVTVDVPPAQVSDGTNVVARSVSAHACVFLLVANFDSLPGSAGANDNASGVAVLMELSRQFALRDEVPAVCFVATDAGFAGSLGAEKYASSVNFSSLPAVVVTVRAIGKGDRLTVYGDATLAGDAEAIAEELDIDLAYGGATPPSPGEGEPFRALGIQVLDIVGTTDNGRDDPSSAIVPGRVAAAGRIAGELMARLSAVAD